MTSLVPIHTATINGHEYRVGLVDSVILIETEGAPPMSCTVDLADAIGRLLVDSAQAALLHGARKEAP